MNNTSKESRGRGFPIVRTPQESCSLQDADMIEYCCELCQFKCRDSEELELHKYKHRITTADTLLK